MAGLLLVVDQGTTSTRAMVFDEESVVRGSAAQEFPQIYPQPGWVEHNPLEIWRSVADTVPRALAAAQVQPGQLRALALTNQRETVLLWDRFSGEPVGRALVWQDRRTADFCRQRQADEPWLQQKTGLVLDPYFSATKIRWLLEQDPHRRRAAEEGRLLAGTIDTWLLWQFTKGRVHATDVSNASRTLLLNLESRAWDEELCAYFQVPPALLPEVRPSACAFGETADLGFLPAGLPIAGMAGDQQAALFGQGGFAPGDAKCTYGTGAFFLQNIGAHPARSQHRLLTSVAACPGTTPHYVLEGSVFVAGAAVQWLRDGMRFIPTAAEVEALAAQSDPQQPVLFVPAFVGLGAPHWAPDARGTIFGLTRNTTAADLARAALEGVAFQVADLIDAAAADTGQRLPTLRADGGMARNAWFLQRQADLLGLPLQATMHTEATALGAAFLAGLQVGIWKDQQQLLDLVQAGPRHEPRLDATTRQTRRDTWRRAVAAVVDFYRGTMSP